MWDNGFALTKWIREDLLNTNTIQTMDQLKQFYTEANLFLIGPEKRKITDDEFFLAYKAAELLVKDLAEFEEKRKAKQIFRRRLE